jgi:hypothetical protein
VSGFVTLSEPLFSVSTRKSGGTFVATNIYQLIADRGGNGEEYA